MNKVDLTPEKNNLLQITNSSIAMVKEIAKKKEIEIVNLIDENINFFANNTSVKTILRNLLSNAIKFSPRKTTITVNAINQNQSSSYIDINVTDNGVGIPKENIDKLFKIETNVSTYGTEKEKGTGLGLILCRELVEKNGGRIWVESTEQIGSIFHFTIQSSY